MTDILPSPRRYRLLYDIFYQKLCIGFPHQISCLAPVCIAWGVRYSASIGLSWGLIWRKSSYITMSQSSYMTVWLSSYQNMIIIWAQVALYVYRLELPILCKYWTAGPMVVREETLSSTSPYFWVVFNPVDINLKVCISLAHDWSCLAPVFIAYYMTSTIKKFVLGRGLWERKPSRQPPPYSWD